MPARKGAKKRFPWIIILALGTVVVVILLGIRSEFSSSPTVASGYPREISLQQAKTELTNGALLLDVREKDEYTKSHISGSLWIPLGDLLSWLDELPGDRLIIVVCQTGVRSAQGRNILLESGYSTVTSLSGGMQAWIAAGYPVESGPPTSS
jgi:rhodanese-related sulfurtransferase